jgi:CO/xanthine dehydrogenase FAD-binding subunit
MKPAPFSYLAPGSVSEALSLLESHADDAKVLAGGQSLVPLMNFRLARPRYLIDINGLGELRNLVATQDGVTLGALVRHSEVERSQTIMLRFPLLSEAIGFVGYPAIRNRGTIGGSLVHADPAAELPVALLALDGTVEAQSKRGSRSLKADEFHIGFLTTAIAPDELLTKVHLPDPRPGTGWCFTEIARRQGDFAIVAVGVLLSVDERGKVGSARVALGGVGPVPIRIQAAEQLLLGESPTDALFRTASETAARELEPESDIHASAEYRRHVAAVLTRRALAVALTRARA